MTVCYAFSQKTLHLDCVFHLLHKGSDSLLQAHCLSGDKTMKCSNSREEWLHSASVSASTLFLTIGSHYPAPLCLCYGKRATSPLERNWHTIIWGCEELRLIVSRLHKPPQSVWEGGLIREGWGKAKRQFNIHCGCVSGKAPALLRSRAGIFVAGRL